VGTLVTASSAARPPVAVGAGPAGALVSIDAREAVIVRWAGGASSVERLASDVPAHRRSTGHVRHDPMTRHGGGGGAPQTAGEPHRLEHLDRFVDEVAARLAADEDIVLVGHGTVHERLETRLRDLDAGARRGRRILARPADRLTERQLIAQLREHLGVGARRRRVGG
jgi:hypothetical protein